MTRANTTRFVNRGPLRFAYTPPATGDGAFVVALHDLLNDRRSFEPLRELLAAQTRLILPDLRGHGASAAVADRSLDIEDLAGDVQAALDAERVDSVIIIGTGLGAAVAVALACFTPAKVQAIVLIDPPTMTEVAVARSVERAIAVDGLRSADTEAARVAYAGQSTRSLELYLGSRFGEDWRMSLSPTRQATAHRSAPSLTRLLPALAAWQPDIALLQRSVRTVVVGSTRESMPAVAIAAEEMAAVIPAARLVHLTASGWPGEITEILSKLGD